MSQTNRFSINLDLTNVDILEIRSLVEKFITEKAESGIIQFYRPEQNKTETRGIIVGTEIFPGKPSEEDVDKVLDVMKKAYSTPEGQKAQKMITVVIPLL